MKDWLASNFIRIGAIALVVDLLNRFYFQVGMGMLVEASALRGDTISETTRYAHVSTGLDLLTALLWGLFTLGFAIRVLKEFARSRH